MSFYRCTDISFRLNAASPTSTSDPTPSSHHPPTYECPPTDVYGPNEIPSAFASSKNCTFSLRSPDKRLYLHKLFSYIQYLQCHINI